LRYQVAWATGRGESATAAEQRDRLLDRLGLGGLEDPGHCSVLMGKRIDLVVALAAVRRLSAIHVPLFTSESGQGSPIHPPGSRR
jgi:hypothetical protein